MSLPHPRNRLDAAFRAIVDDLYSTLTSRLSESLGAQRHLQGGRLQPLPHAAINRLMGFLDRLPLATALHLLAFAELKEGRIKLTAAGRVLAGAGRDERKGLFREHLLRFVPLAAHIRQVLEERGEHVAPSERFALELEDHLTRHDVTETLRTGSRPAFSSSAARLLQRRRRTDRSLADRR